MIPQSAKAKKNNVLSFRDQNPSKIHQKSQIQQTSPKIENPPKSTNNVFTCQRHIAPQKGKSSASGKTHVCKGLDRAMDCTHAVIGPYTFPLKRCGEQKQISWNFRYILDVLYAETHDKAERRKKGKSAWKGMVETHQLLWPGMRIPEKENLADEACGHFNIGIATSLVLSMLVWALRNPKRSNASRDKADQMLTEIITHLAENSGFSIQFPVFEADGSKAADLQQSVDATLKIQCWSQSMSEALAPYWDADFRGQRRPFTSLHHTSIIDLVVWAMTPVPQKMKGPLRGLKQIIEQSAFFIVTHVALAFERKAGTLFFAQGDRELDEDMASGEEEVCLKGRKRKLNPSLANSIAEKAARLLFSGKVSWICLVGFFWQLTVGSLVGRLTRAY